MESSARKFILFDLAEGRFFTLRKELLDRQLVLGIVGVEHLELLNEIMGDASIRVREL